MHARRFVSERIRRGGIDSQLSQAFALAEQEGGVVRPVEGAEGVEVGGVAVDFVDEAFEALEKAGGWEAAGCDE